MNGQHGPGTGPLPSARQVPTAQVPPGWAVPGPAPLSSVERRPPQGFVGASLALAVVALSVGVLGVVVGLFCVGFITAFGAPLTVTQPAMAGFAFWGTVVTAPFFLAAVVVLVVGVVRRGWTSFWVAPLVVDAVTLIGLVIAVSSWFHPGVHISSDFAS